MIGHLWSFFFFCSLLHIVYICSRKGETDRHKVEPMRRSKVTKRPWQLHKNIIMAKDIQTAERVLQTNSQATYIITGEQLMTFVQLYAEQMIKERDDEREKQEQRFSQKEAARYLGKSVPTLWRWQKEGYLHADGYVGSQPYYFKQTLDNLK